MNLNKNKSLKINLIIVIILLSLFSLSCSRKENNPNIPDSSEYSVFPQEMTGIIKDKKIYVTSIGQDAEIIKFQLSTLEKQDYFTYTIDTFLEASEVSNDSVVIAFVGCSIKALSESDTSVEKETERAIQFIQKARKNEITLIVIHAGGSARRGSTSDKLIEQMFSNSHFNIFVESGNFDGFLSKVSYENNVKCYQIKSSLSLKNTIDKLYGVEN